MKLGILRFLLVAFAGIISCYAQYEPPTADIDGTTRMPVGGTGTWTYTTSDPDADLYRWRVSLDPNSAQWTYISGDYQSASFNYTFNTLGVQKFTLEVEDIYGNITEDEITVIVDSAPVINFFYPSVYTAVRGQTILIWLSASDIDNNMSHYAVRHVGFGGINPGGVGALTPSASGFTQIFSYTIPAGCPLGSNKFRAEVGDWLSIPGDPPSYGIFEFYINITN